MTLADVNRLFAYWAVDPPPGVLINLIARMIGWKPPELEASPASYEEAANENADWFAAPDRFFKK